MMARFVRTALVAVALGLAGCSSTGKHIRWYEGASLGSSEVAVLRIQRGLFQYSAFVEAIDGKSIRKLEHIASKEGATLDRNNTEEIELLPGIHSVEFGYYGGHAHSVSNAMLVVDFKAGRTYELHAARIDEGFMREFSKTLAGGYGYWTGWIIDAETKEVLAGKARTQPLRWYE